MLARSSSVSFPPAPTLAHSLNSRGELGMFVNPYGCPCQTCVDYLADRGISPGAEPAPVPERAPTPPPAPVPVLRDSGGWSVPVWPELGALRPAPANQIYWTGSGWVSEHSDFLRSVAVASSELPPPTPSLTRSLTLGMGAPPALARTVTGLGYAPATVEEAEESDEEADGDGAAAPARSLAAAFAAAAADPEESALMERLKNLRARLSLQQEAVHEQEFRSHDEMAAADAEWEILDNKISAIDDLLRAFRGGR